jgi:hypothetical protein
LVLFDKELSVNRTSTASCQFKITYIHGDAGVLEYRRYVRASSTPAWAPRLRTDGQAEVSSATKQPAIAFASHKRDLSSAIPPN